MEDNEIKTRNTDKKRIEALEAEVAHLNSSLSRFTAAVIHVFHVVGAPHDILVKHGLTPHKKEDGKAA